MKRVLALALITMLLLPGIAFAGPSTDAALALGAFAALGTILMGAAALGHPAVAPAPVVVEPPAPPAVYAPAPPVVAAPPPVVYAPQPQAVYAPPPVVYLPAPPPVVYAPRVHRHRYYDRYAYDVHGHRW
jgi:hypothetical protein